MEIIEIFPEIIYKDNINLSLEDIKYLTDSRLKGETPNGFGNTTSADKSILDDKELTVLREKIQSHLDCYIDKIIGCIDLKLRITQSWLNFNDKGTSHHTHNHPNSIVSGVLYITKEPTSIVILRDYYKQIFQPNYTKKTKYNLQTFLIEPKLGDLLLFPSYLTHGVQLNEVDTTRVSLSFNTFYKGTLGVKQDATYLEII